MDIFRKIGEIFVFSIQSENAFCSDSEIQSPIAHYNTEFNQHEPKRRCSLPDFSKITYFSPSSMDIRTDSDTMYPAWAGPYIYYRSSKSYLHPRMF